MPKSINNAVKTNRNQPPEIRVDNVEKNVTNLWRKVIRLESDMEHITGKTQSRIGDSTSISDILDYMERERTDSRLNSLMCSEM